MALAKFKPSLDEKIIILLKFGQSFHIDFALFPPGKGEAIR